MGGGEGHKNEILYIKSTTYLTFIIKSFFAFVPESTENNF